MANTPHDEEPRPAPKSNVPPAGDKPDDGSLDNLPALDPSLLESTEMPGVDPALLESTELPYLDPGLLESAELPAGAFLDESLPDLAGERAPDSAEVQYDSPPPAGSAGSGVSYGVLSDESEFPEGGLSNIPASEDLDSGTDWGALPGSASGDSRTIPNAEPASGVGAHAAGEIPPGADSLEPVAPASDWLDSVEKALPPTRPTAGADEPAEAMESSDIFGGGPVKKAAPAEYQSDVIAATSKPDGAGEPPARTSDVALSFDRPPGGSTSPEMGGSAELPVAEEVFDLEDATEEAGGLPFDSARLADAPPLPDATEPVDVPNFGTSPEATSDASSILADLMEPAEGGTKDSSAIRLEAPWVDRTLSSDQGEGTEFDLTITDALPHELIAEAASDHGPAEWEHLPDPGMFAEDKTIPEVHLGDPSRVVPVDPTWASDEPPVPASPSSIFSDRPADEGSSVPLSAKPAAEEGDSSVEFSDHPEAETEASASSIMGRPLPARTPPPGRPKSKPGAGDFGIPADAAADWGLTDEKEVPARAGGRDAGDSSILSRDTITREDLEREAEGTLPEPRHPAPAPAARGKPAPRGKTPSRGDRGTSDPSVEIDWLAGSASAELPAAADAGGEGSPAAPAARTREKARAAAPAAGSKKGAWIGGTLLGMVIAGGGFAGAYFGDLLPRKEPTAQRPGGGQPGTNTNTGNTGAGAATAADAAAAIRAGDSARARQIVEGMKDATPAVKALAGEAGLFALVQQKGTAVQADDADLKAARENLQAVVDDADAAATAEGKRAAVKAAVQLGISHEIAGDAAAAKKVYEAAKARFPEHADTFDAALTRLAETQASGRTSRRLDPADARQILLAVTLLQADGKADDVESGVHFWKAVNRAAGGKYAEAVEEIGKAKAAHVKQAKAKAGAGLNPLSDPLEQIFPRCCDDLKAYWELRAAIYANKAVADLYKKDGAEKAFAQLAAAQTKAADTTALTAKFKDATDKLTKANADLTKATTDLTRAGTDLTRANADLKKAEGDLKDAKAMVVTLQKDVKAAEEVRLAVEKKAEAEEKARKLAETAAKDADAARARSEQFVGALAKELQAAKLLPEKYSADELLAAQKRTAERATGPTLNTLVPGAMMAVGGSGLSAGQLIDIAERLSKAETAAKTAADRLATETRQLKTDHAAELKKLTDGYAADLKKATGTHTAEVKKLTDAHAVALKKATDATATEVAKLKDDHRAELKKATDKFAADAKVLKDGFEGKVKSLEAAVVAERDRVAALTAQFKRDLGNAISPTEALDLWLPLLVELRRPADADPALATATKVIAGAPAGSEDAAKARTVAGLALLIKNEPAQAKAQLQAAKSSPAHQAALAAKKPWAAATDGGLAALNDPLAPYRKPVSVPGRDALAAARLLDAGVKAYREERHEAAVAALGDSVKADPTNPVAWYYLGAARWATGATDAARGDFQQGATRESASDQTARAINAALAPIQGAARDALTASRQ